jgi:hypothetical protein
VNPLVILVPAAILTGGLAAFLLIPLPIGVRTAILLSDIAAAAIVGFLLWRRHH